MKGIIIFESLHGSTEKCANKLLELLPEGFISVRLQHHEDLNIEEYDTVIIGGSIHMGVIQTRIENFIKKNFSLLAEKKIGLYLCCMEVGETAQLQFNKAYPEELRKKALARGLFGGEFNLRKMSFFEKKFTRKATGIKSSVSKIDEEEIRRFALRMSERVNG